MNHNIIKRFFGHKLTLCALLFTAGYAQAHSVHLNEKAVIACEQKQRSDVCQYEGGHNDLYVGSCQYMSTTLMCVRNQPIQKISPTETESDHTHQND